MSRYIISLDLSPVRVTKGPVLTLMIITFIQLPSSRSRLYIRSRRNDVKMIRGF